MKEYISKKIKIAGNEGWDYLAVDNVNQHLFVSHGNVVNVIDLKSDESLSNQIAKNVEKLIIDKELANNLVKNVADLYKLKKDYACDLKVSDLYHFENEPLFKGEYIYIISKDFASQRTGTYVPYWHWSDIKSTYKMAVLSLFIFTD